MSYVKAFLFTLVVSFVIGGVLVYFQQDKNYELKLDIKEKHTNEYITNFTIKTFPKMTPQYSEDLSGKGRLIYRTELYTGAFVMIKAEGYKTKIGFYIWDATKDNPIYLKKDEKHNKEENKEENKQKNKNKEKKNVDMLPNFKKESEK